MSRKSSGGGKKGPAKGKYGTGGLSASLGGARNQTVRVKTAKRRSNASARWLDRQLNDPYVAEARRRGLRSRAAFKMLEIDDKYEILAPGMAVIDLGCAPGGWTQVAVDRAKSEKGGGVVVGVDILPAEQVPGAEIFQADFMDDATPDRLMALLGRKADVVLTDMAASSTGHSQTDHLRIIGLAEAALDFAIQVLNTDGAFVAKVFSGGAEADLLAVLKQNFRKVAHFKPSSSRKESAEMYVVARGFRGGVNLDADPDAGLGTSPGTSPGTEPDEAQS